MYLSKENIQHVETLCHGFLKSKHNIDLPATAITQLVNAFSQKLFSTTDINNTNIETFNKQLILQIREHVISNLAKRAPQPNIPPAPKAPPPAPKPPITNSDIYAVPESDKTDENQDEFFQKLQQLEMQRKAPIATPPPEPVPANPSRLSNVQVSSTTTTVPTPPPPTPITVIVPSTTVANHGIITRIHSIDRNWIYNRAISSMVWSGPLPKQIDENNIRIVALMLPRVCMECTPYVLLRIEGAGGQQADVCMLPSESVVGTWVKYQPCTANEHMRKFATPWTLRLLDAYEKDLQSIGEDSWLLPESSMQTIAPSLHRFSPNPSSNQVDILSSFRIGDRILVQDSKANQYHYIITKMTNTVLEGKDATCQDLPKEFPCYILNETRQWTLLLESHQTNHVSTKST